MHFLGRDCIHLSRLLISSSKENRFLTSGSSGPVLRVLHYLARSRPCKALCPSISVEWKRYCATGCQGYFSVPKWRQVFWNHAMPQNVELQDVV